MAALAFDDWVPVEWQASYVGALHVRPVANLKQFLRSGCNLSPDKSRSSEHACAMYIS